MKITVLNNINYYFEALGIITSYIKDENFYEAIKESQKVKYNIPMEKLDVLFDEISKIYDYVVKKINTPIDKLKFYFASFEDEVPNIGHLLMSFIMYDDDEKTIRNFMQLSTNEKLRKYMNALSKNTDVGIPEIDIDEIDDKYYVNFINRTNLGADAKLKYILMYYNLEEYLSEVYEIVKKVVLILKSKQRKLQDIADNFKNLMVKDLDIYGDKLFENYDIKISVDKDLFIKPLLIRSNSLILKPWVLDADKIVNLDSTNVYIGIHVKELFDLIGTYFINDERIIATLKALGDRSKFDILKSIKDTQMYGVEIAKKLNLTTATVSHHMSNLYNLSLINFVADNNKMNYMLNKDTVAEIINALQSIFLK